MIQCEGLCKSYRYYEKAEGMKASVKALFRRTPQWREALKPLSFAMDKGEFLGVMGPNGAGKSTLIKLLTGIVHPTQGTARVLGETPDEAGNAFKKRIAVVMGQKSQLWWDLPAGDTLSLQKTMYGMDEAAYRRSRGELCELFDVEALVRVPVRQLSLGERMKFELICALLHEPELLFLDEPTIGLDAPSQLAVRRMLKEAGRSRGVSLVLTSHYTQDLLDVTPRVLVIREGECVYDGDLKALLHAQSECRVVRLELRGELPGGVRPEWVRERAGTSVELRVPARETPALLSLVLASGAAGDVHVEDEDVTELVDRLYQGGARA